MRIATVIAFVQFTNALEYMVFNPIFVFMATDFAVPVSFSGYVSGMYTLGAVLSGIIAFYWIDHFNKKRFLIINMALLGLLTFLTTCTSSFSLLLALRFCAGLVGGTTMGVGISILINNAPTDGTHYATVSSTQQLVDITLWDWTQIHFASDSNQDMTIQIKATSIEQSNQQSTSTLKTVTVKMLGGQACLSPWQLVNGFVSTWVNHVESIPLHVKAHWSCQIPLLSAQLDLNILPKDEDEDLIILGQEEQSDAWLKALERTAQQNWKQLF